MTSDVPEYTSKRGRELGPADKLPFKLDGDPYVLLRPKLSIATAMLALLDDGQKQRSTVVLGIDLTRLLNALLAYVEPMPPEPPTIGRGATSRPNPKAGAPRGQQLLRARLDNPLDGFDLPDLEPVFRDLMDVMFQRPTQARPESPEKPRGKASGGSGAGTRSKQRKTSTT